MSPAYQIRTGFRRLRQWTRRKPGMASERLLESHLLYQNPKGEILSLKTSSFSRMFWSSELNNVKAAWKEKNEKTNMYRDMLLKTVYFLWVILFYCDTGCHFFELHYCLKYIWKDVDQRQDGFTGEKAEPVLFLGLLNCSLRPKACCIYNGYMLCLFYYYDFFFPPLNLKTKKYYMLFIWLHCFAFCLSKAMSQVFSL